MCLLSLKKDSVGFLCPPKQSTLHTWLAVKWDLRVSHTFSIPETLVKATLPKFPSSLLSSAEGSFLFSLIFDSRACQMAHLCFLNYECVPVFQNFRLSAQRCGLLSVALIKHDRWFHCLLYCLKYCHKD